MSDADATTKTQSPRTVHQNLHLELEQIKTLVQEAALDAKVEYGSILWNLGDQINEVLDLIKEELRKETKTRLGDTPGQETFEGDDLGAAVVTAPKPSLRVPKGKDIAPLKAALGSDFSLFFEEVTTFKPRKEFDERVTALSNPLHQQILLNSIERVDPTLRVSFKRSKEPKADREVTKAPVEDFITTLLDE